jgi:hypothetical protein
MNKPINASACGVIAALAKPCASAFSASLRGGLHLLVMSQESV